MIEHSSRELSVFLLDERRQYSVIPDVVVALVLVISDPYSSQPLYTSAAHVARNHQSYGISMIRW